jgi:hypothetical protein
MWKQIGNYRLADGVKGKALKLDRFTIVIRLTSDKVPESYNAMKEIEKPESINYNINNETPGN